MRKILIFTVIVFVFQGAFASGAVAKRSSKKKNDFYSKVENIENLDSHLPSQNKSRQLASQMK